MKHGDKRYTARCPDCDGVLEETYQEEDHSGHPGTWNEAGWTNYGHDVRGCIRSLAKRLKEAGK